MAQPMGKNVKVRGISARCYTGPGVNYTSRSLIELRKCRWRRGICCFKVRIRRTLGFTYYLPELYVGGGNFGIWQSERLENELRHVIKCELVRSLW